MSCLTTRIGRHFTNLKKFVNRDGFILRGNRLTGATTADMTSWSKVDAKHDLKQTGPDIYYLEEIANKEAIKLIQADIKDENRCFLKRKPKLPNFKLDWSNLKFTCEKPCITRTYKDEVISHVISKTAFTNESNIEQCHKQKVERQLSSVCESHLTKGFITGFELEIPFPESCPIGPTPKLSLNLGKVNSEVKLPWVFEDCFKVPTGSTITVLIKSKEQQREFDFTAIILVQGEVKLTFYNPRTQTDTDLTIPYTTLIKDIPKPLGNQEKNVKTDGTYIEITGMCKFKYNVEHEIIVKSK